MSKTYSLAGQVKFGQYTTGCHGERTSIRCFLCFHFVLNSRPGGTKKEKNSGLRKAETERTELEVSAAKLCRHMTTKDFKMPLRKAFFSVFPL